MNRSRWLSLGFVVLFMVVTLGVAAWKEHVGRAIERRTDGLYASFALLVMGLICIWWLDTASSDATACKSGGQSEATGDKRRPARSVGWLLLVLSIVIAAADLVR